MNEFRIRFSIVNNEVKTPELSVGSHLEIIVNGMQKDYIEYSEVINKRRSLSEIKSTQGFSSIVDLEIDSKHSLETEVDIPNYTDFVRYILSKIKTKCPEPSDQFDLFIISDLNEILEAPWEKVFLSAIVFRKYISNGDITLNSDDPCNLVILMSHAHEGIAHSLAEVMNQEIDSIYCTIQTLRINRSQSLRINKILLSKHTTKKALQEIDWKSYNFLHMICHGDSNGDLVLEDERADRYIYPDIMEKETFTNLFDKKAFQLVFLSFCNSAGGTTIDESVAFKLIKKGVTNYCISYFEGVGEIRASNFTSIFYKYMLRGTTIQETYKKTLLKYKEMNPDTVYSPYIFLRS